MKQEIYRHLQLLSEPLRVRLLRLLEREELGVGELTSILQVPQSTISRHVKALLGGDWIARRTEGTSSLLRMAPEALGEAALDLWRVVRDAPCDADQAATDLRRLESALAARQIDSQAFFGRVAAEWDTVRRALFGEGFLPSALLALMAGDWVIGDLGCGTGVASGFLAPVCRQVIAVDREEAMLEAARRRLSDNGNVDIRQGDLLSLPIEDRALDAAVCVLVLHHIEHPEAALTEIRRVLRPGGRLLLVDMTQHDRAVYRKTMGHHHQGFSQAATDALAVKSGLSLVSWRRLPVDPEAQGPDLFAATLLRRGR